MSRPQKEWLFATPKERISVKVATAKRKKLVEEKVGTGTHRMTRKKHEHKKQEICSKRHREKKLRRRRRLARNQRKSLPTVKGICLIVKEGEITAVECAGGEKCEQQQ
jgi:hypothetical protein